MIEHIQGFAGASIIFRCHRQFTTSKALGRLRPAGSAPGQHWRRDRLPGYFRAGMAADRLHRCTEVQISVGVR